MTTDRAVAADGLADDLHPGRRPLPAPLVALLGALLTAAVVVAFAVGGAATALVLVLVAGVLVSVLFLGSWSFTRLFVVACVARPLADLTAGPRTQGVALTELFGIGMLAVTATWLFLHRRELAPRLVGALPLSLLALVVAYALASFSSQDPADGLAATLRIAAGVAVFLVVDLLLATGRLSLTQLLQLVGLVSVVPLLYPLLGVVGVPVTKEKDGISALKSVFFLSNNFGHFLVPLLVLGVAWALRSHGWQRRAALAYTAVVVVELVASQTRGAWLGAAIGVLLVCLLLNRRVALIGAVGLVVAALVVPAINQRIVDLAPDASDPYSESSFAWRLDQWQRLASEVTVNPVTGGGPGVSVRLTGKEAHNDYLKAGAETGVFGFGVYLWFLGAALVTSWAAALRVRRLRRQSRDSPQTPGPTPLAEAAFAAIAGYAVAVVVTSSAENLIDNLTFLWSALPLLAAAHWALRAAAEELVVEGDS